MGVTWRELRGMESVWGSERREKAFWRQGRAPVDAAKLSASRCSTDTCSVDEDAPIPASASAAAASFSPFFSVAENYGKFRTATAPRLHGATSLYHLYMDYRNRSIIELIKYQGLFYLLWPIPNKYWLIWSGVLMSNSLKIKWEFILLYSLFLLLKLFKLKIFFMK